MNALSIYELCQPREDVLAGVIRDEDFAADLSQVLKGTAPELYLDPCSFFANTYPTRGIKELIKAVVGRLTGVESQLGSILRLDTTYGGGKTHALIGLNHILTKHQNIPNLSEFVDPNSLPSKPVTVAAFDGENADPMNGRTMTEGVLAFTPWGELAFQLAGRSGYERIRKSDILGAAPPGAETIRELIGDRPVLILIDELSIYLRKLKGSSSNKAAEQLTPFLTDLIKAVNSSPNAVLVFTLALGKGGQTVDAYGEENQRIARIFAELESVTGRQSTPLTPTSEDETVQVLSRRLFESIDRSRVPEVVRQYEEIWNRRPEALPEIGQIDDRSSRMIKGYPLHPELIDTLLQKTATLDNFQRVRGMLRLLTQTVGQLWKERPNTYAIHTYHIDPSNERIRTEISAKLQQHALIPAIRSEVCSTASEEGRALAQRLDETEFKGMEPYGSMVARTILFHSLAFNDPLKGLSRLDLNWSLYGPGVDPAFIDKAVRHIQEESEYLDDSGSSKLRYLTDANLNQMVRRREGQFDLESVRAELNRRIGTIFAKQRFEPVIFPSNPGDVPDDTEGPYLVLIHWEGHTVDQVNVTLPDLVVRLFKEKGAQGKLRLNKNNLVFVCADSLQIDEMLRKTRTFLALKQMTNGDLFSSLQSHQKDQIQERFGKAQQSFALAVQQAYRHIFYPDRGPWDTPLTHATVTITNASSEPGIGQKQVERVLRDANELVLPEDNPPAPNYMADKTPLKRRGEMSMRDLRNEYFRDPCLPILIGDEVLKKCLRMGLEQGFFVYKEGDRLEGKDLPAGILSINEDARVYMRERAEEISLWPPKINLNTKDVVNNGNGLSTNNNSLGAGHSVLQTGESSNGVSIPSSIDQQSQNTVGPLTDNIKTILTRFADQITSSRKRVVSLTWQMEGEGGFLPLSLLKAEPGGTVKVHMMEGGWSSNDDRAEWSFQFAGIPEEAEILKAFITSQWRRGGEKDLNICYELQYEPPLSWNDNGVGWIGRLTRAGLGAHQASITVELEKG